MITKDSLDAIKNIHKVLSHEEGATNFEWHDVFDVEEIHCNDEADYVNTVEAWCKDALPERMRVDNNKGDI